MYVLYIIVYWMTNVLYQIFKILLQESSDYATDLAT